MEETNEHVEIKRLLEENSALLKENHKLLKKIHRNSVIELIMRLVWYGILIGLPFVLYFLLKPYFEAFGANYDTFIDGLNELPGLKGIDALFD